MALGYREQTDTLKSKNIQVFGINDKDAENAREWIEKESLPFTILLDPSREVGVLYGISDYQSDKYVSNASDGRRPAVVINENGYIEFWDPDMNTVDQINELIDNL